MLRRAFLLWLTLCAATLSGAAQADQRREIKGRVIAIEAGDPTLLAVRTEQGKTFEVAVTEDTVIKLDGNRFGDVEDIEVGDKLEIHHDGDFVATKIEIKDREGRDDDDDVRLREIRGVITNINTAADPDRLTVRLANGSLVTVRVTDNTEIELDGEAADLTDLGVGDRVEVKYDARTSEAFRIEAEVGPREVRGVLVDLDLDLGLALVDTDGDGEADLELELTDTTIIRLGDLRLDEDELDLLVGVPVRVKYLRGTTPDTGTLLEIKGETQFAEVITGEVLEVDLDNRVLTIQPNQGDLIELHIPEALRVLRSGRPVSLDAVAEGDRVRVLALLDEEGDAGVALRVELLAPVLKKLNGRITAVNGDTFVVVVRGQEFTFEVDDNTRFTLNNRRATLASLQTALAQGRKIQAQVTFRERDGDDLAVEVKANANASRGGR